MNLITAIVKFNKRKKTNGLLSNKMVVKEFDRDIVVESYLQEIGKFQVINDGL